MVYTYDMKNYFVEWKEGERNHVSRLFKGKKIAFAQAHILSTEGAKAVVLCETDGMGHVKRTDVYSLDAK